MKKNRLLLLLTIFVVAAMVLAACGGGAEETEAPAAPTDVPAPEPTDPPPPPPTDEPMDMPMTDIGTADHPIKLMFVPSVDAEEIVAGADLLVAELTEATGLIFEVIVPTSYAATLVEMCASPDDTIGFIPGLGYTLANDLCGVDAAAKATRFTLDWYAAMFFTRRDSGLDTLADLDGKKWAYPDASSTSGFLFPTKMMSDEGVVPGESFAAGGHSNVVRAVYNGEADFGTAFYSPPNINGVSLGLASLDSPDVPADLLESCAVLEEGGTALCGEDASYEPRDARRNIRGEVDDSFQSLQIVAITIAIANDLIAFGPDFPSDLRESIMQALFDFATNDPDGFAAAMDPYSWTDLTEVTDADYDAIRAARDAAGFSIDDLGE